MSLFSKIPVKAPKHSVHNLSYSNKLTVEFGRLYPILCRKVIPGDRFVGNEQVFCQFAAMASKVYQEFKIQTQYFFVPSRTLWDDFEDFLVGGYDGMQSFVHPYFDYRKVFSDTFAYVSHPDLGDCYQNIRFLPSTTYTAGICPGPVHGSLFDYMNFPTVERKQFITLANDRESYQIIRSILSNGGNDDYHYDALPFVALLKIYCDHYADENLQHHIIEKCDELIKGQTTDFSNDWTSFIELGNEAWMSDGQVVKENNKYYHFFRNYSKDYFTGALPFVQKGPQVNLPFTGFGQVRTYLDQSVPGPAHSYAEGVTTSTLDPNAPDPAVKYRAVEQTFSVSSGLPQTGLRRYVHFDNGLTAIEDLRTALQVQHFYEVDARGGTRYNEQILSHFGVRTPDARLGRAEFLMSHTTYVNLGNVYTTSLSADGSQIAGEPVSVARAGGRSRNWKLRAREHGYVIAFVSVIPRAAYFKGVPREYMELDKFDYYWPEFQHLGEDAVYAGEVLLSSNPKDKWGYNPRYAHYRTATNQIHGDFRGSLKFMNDARDLPEVFNSGIQIAPFLNANFVSVNPYLNNLNRIFNYKLGDYDHVQLDIFMNIKPSRPMSYFGLPRLLG